MTLLFYSGRRVTCNAVKPPGKIILKNKYYILLVIIACSINYGNEPLPPPFYKYSISGHIVCDTLKTKANYAVLLYGKYDDISEYHLIAGSEGLGNQKELSVTNTGGYFSLLINDYNRLDSIKIGVLGRNNIIRFSQIYSLDKSKFQEVLKEYSNKSGSGCSSCASESTQLVISNYYYQQENVQVDLCK